jgi:hypothetical protein
MCPFRRRVSFSVYMPQKPKKYDTKLFILAESRTCTYRILRCTMGRILNWITVLLG